MKYPVEVAELSQRIVEVEADSRAEAERIAEEMWNQEETVLDSNDFKRAFFKAEEVPEKIRVLVVKPGKRPERREIGAELEDMQRVVGGRIQKFQPLRTRLLLSAMRRENWRDCRQTGQFIHGMETAKNAVFAFFLGAIVDFPGEVITNSERLCAFLSAMPLYPARHSKVVGGTDEKNMKKCSVTRNVFTGRGMGLRCRKPRRSGRWRGRKFGWSILFIDSRL